MCTRKFQIVFYRNISKLSTTSVFLFVFAVTLFGFLYSVNYTGSKKYNDSKSADVSSFMKKHREMKTRKNIEQVTFRVPLPSTFSSSTSSLTSSKSQFSTNKLVHTNARSNKEFTSTNTKRTNYSKSPLKSTNADCNCKSEKTGKLYNFCYVDPQNKTSIGKKFDCASLKILEKLELVDNPGPFVNLANFKNDTSEMIFVTATSEDHINQAIGFLESFYKFNPTGKCILYGLALVPHRIKMVKSKFKHLEVRVFNSTGYPKYVNHWTEYRFKSLIIAEALKEYSNIWWMDANARVEKGNMSELLHEEIGGVVEKNGADKVSPIYSLVYTGHSNFPVMFPELLTYFPSNSIPLLKSEKHGSQLGANVFFISKTPYTIELFKWMVLCSLDKVCMSPPGAQVFCKFGKNRNDEFAHCFRFDQSVLNLLLLNDFQDHNKYFSKLGYLISRTP